MRYPLATALMLTLVGPLVGCKSPTERTHGLTHPTTYAPLTGPQEAELDALRRAADAAPGDYQANKEAGLRMMDYALSGALPQQVEAEHYLERAFALRTDDEELLRTLGRFYNMRAVEHDFSKASMQVRVYGALLGTEEPMDMSVEHFVAHSFFMLAQMIQAADEKHLFAALRTLRALEHHLDERTTAQPDDVELHALAGNYALFFAGYVPVGRRGRLRRGIEHFEYVKAHWSQMRPGARDALRCPNTYENFVFELGEAHLALGQRPRAREIYEELTRIRGSATRGKELIAAVSQHRLDNLDAYARHKELMPPWPSDVGNCIVCHAYTGQIPANTLYVAPGLTFDLAATASTATARPVGAIVAPASSDTDPLSTECGACHAPGGRASHILDTSDLTVVIDRRAAIVDAIDSGRMPPDRTLPATERDALSRYVRGLGAGVEASK